MKGTSWCVLLLTLGSTMMWQGCGGGPAKAKSAAWTRTEGRSRAGKKIVEKSVFRGGTEPNMNEVKRGDAVKSRKPVTRGGVTLPGEDKHETRSGGGMSKRAESTVGRIATSAGDVTRKVLKKSKDTVRTGLENVGNAANNAWGYFKGMFPGSPRSSGTSSRSPSQPSGRPTCASYQCGNDMSRSQNMGVDAPCAGLKCTIDECCSCNGDYYFDNGKCVRIDINALNFPTTDAEEVRQVEVSLPRSGPITRGDIKLKGGGGNAAKQSTPAPQSVRLRSAQLGTTKSSATVAPQDAASNDELQCHTKIRLSAEAKEANEEAFRMNNKWAFQQDISDPATWLWKAGSGDQSSVTLTLQEGRSINKGSYKYGCFYRDNKGNNLVIKWHRRSVEPLAQFLEDFRDQCIVRKLSLKYGKVSLGPRCIGDSITFKYAQPLLVETAGGANEVPKYGFLEQELRAFHKYLTLHTSFDEKLSKCLTSASDKFAAVIKSETGVKIFDMQGYDCVDTPVCFMTDVALHLP